MAQTVLVTQNNHQVLALNQTRILHALRRRGLTVVRAEEEMVEDWLMASPLTNVFSAVG